MISIDVKTPKQKGKETQKLEQDLLNDFYEKFNDKIKDFGLCYMQDRNTDFSYISDNQIKKFVKYEEADKELYKALRKNKKDTPDIIFQVTIYNSKKNQKDYIEINIKNADPQKIKSSGTLAAYRTEKGLNINSSDFKGSLENAISILRS